MATRTARKPRRVRKTGQDEINRAILADAQPAPRVEGKASGSDDDGYNNKTERAYAAHLELRKRAGEIKDWFYEPCRLRVADLKRGRIASAAGRCEIWYTPDFLIIENNDRIVIHELKGRETQAAMNRFRAAAALHHYRFVLVKRDGNGWSEEVFQAED